MSGIDLADALARALPSQLDRVVFMTGGAFTSRARDFRDVRAARCVDKPFDVVSETARRLEGRGPDRAEMRRSSSGRGHWQDVPGLL